MLPDLYQPWIEALIGGSIPAESEATCGNCAMLPDPSDASPAPASDSRQHARTYFDPAVKCCTYVPFLANFLVGRILRDDDPKMAPRRATVEARVAAGAGVTPAGLEQPPTFALLYQRGGTDTFGRAVSLRCPHYQEAEGACGIWRHRNGVCSTWFCKHERGAVGHAFWLSLVHLLRAIERALLTHCVRALDPGMEAMRYVVSMSTRDTRTLTAADVDGIAGEDHRSLWDRYAGREIEFYRRSAAIVDDLAWDDVLRLGGAEVDLAANLAVRAHRDLLSRSLPSALRAAPVQIERIGGDDVMVCGYRPYDPLIVPAPIVHVLHFFDGRPTKQAMAAARETGVPLERRAVRRLVDFGILVAAD